MATSQPVSESAAVQQQYLAQIAVTATLTQALHTLWPATNPLSSQKALTTYRGGVAVVVEQFSQAATSLARDAYMSARTEAGVPGPYQPKPVAMPPRSLVDAGVDWAMRAQAEAADIEAAIMARVDAAMQKAVVDEARAQLVDAVEGDDKALGFRRVARPGACYWCLALAVRRTRRDGERLGVYKSRETAGQLPSNATGQINRYHNNCHCTVEPVFDAAERLPAWLADMETFYHDSTRDSGKGESLNDFRRALAARRRGVEPTAPVITMPTAKPIPGNEALVALLGRLADLGAA